MITVVVSDDHPIYRRAVCETLGSSADFVVVGSTATGEESVDMASRLKPALVVMDVGLPGIDGMEATRRILAAVPEVTIVLVSSLESDELPPDAETCGAVGYVKKENLSPAVLAGLYRSQWNGSTD